VRWCGAVSRLSRFARLMRAFLPNVSCVMSRFALSRLFSDLTRQAAMSSLRLQEVKKGPSPCAASANSRRR
jgi:hypothetical protein